MATAASLEGPDDRPRLLEAARTGDLAAFELLMRRYERLVLVTALRLLGRMEDAQDASQEVFLKLHRNLGKLDGAANLSSWLYKVTLNVCSDLRRRRRPGEAMEKAADQPESTATPESGMVDAERRAALELSLRILSERQREAVVLRDLEGLPTEEVTRIMGSTEATVRSQISQARVKMKGFLERYLGRRS
jgi:RNA polymerase sigma-70 factor (ECF subfamily)